LLQICCHSRLSKGGKSFRRACAVGKCIPPERDGPPTRCRSVHRKRPLKRRM
jgi:hypothetical protein